MQPSPSEFEGRRDKLRQTERWRPAVAKTAALFADVPVDEYNNLVRYLVESGEDKALGILICVCDANDVKLDPQILAEALKVVEPVTDLAFAFRVQEADAIAPLLAVIQAEDISRRRQAVGVTIAAG